MRVKRGEIYYVTRGVQTGSEQETGRPAIVVSNDKNNEHSSVIEVVYLTTKEKNDLPTHVVIRATGTQSIALCEQVYSVSIDRFSDWCGTCTDFEMAMVDIALAISLGLTDVSASDKKKNDTPPEKPVQTAPVTAPAVPSPPDDKERYIEFAKLEGERDTYKKLYEELLNKVVSSR